MLVNSGRKLDLDVFFFGSKKWKLLIIISGCPTEVYVSGYHTRACEKKSIEIDANPPVFFAQNRFS